MFFSGTFAVVLAIFVTAAAALAMLLMVLFLHIVSPLILAILTVVAILV